MPLQKMVKKIKYIVPLLILILLMLSVSGCSEFTPEIITPSQSDNSSQYIDPDWTFASDNSQPSTTLPNFPPVIATAMPSVVSVTTEMVLSSLFGQQTRIAAGSGVIIDDEGYIVTNNHVVQNSKSIQVELTDGRTFPAEIVGTDAFTDFAVLKIDANNLPYAHWGDSALLTAGDWVIAIGNALGEGITATEGIVSRLGVSVTAQGNTLYGLIQTTAAINQGNSGGPLVNMAAEIIGITSVKMAAIGVEGMGYAISSNSAKPIIEDLINQGYVTRPWLGVALYTVNESVAMAKNLSVTEGALILEVVPDSPSEAAGLQEGDVIINFGGKEIKDIDSLIQAIRGSQIGQNVEITYVRGEDTKTTELKLVESPPPQN